MSSIGRYADAATVFGHAANPNDLFERIATFDWHDSFVALSKLAARVANDRGGPGSKALQSWARDCIL